MIRHRFLVIAEVVSFASAFVDHPLRVAFDLEMQIRVVEVQYEEQ